MYNGYEIVKELYVEEDDAVTGEFSTLKGTSRGDLDRRGKRTDAGPQAYQRFHDEVNP